MYILRNRLVRVLALALVLIALVAGYTFAAANTVSPSNVGDGNAAISGYTVTAIHYTLNATNPQDLDSVSFTLAPALVTGGTVKIQLVPTTGAWYTCTGTTSISCTTSGATALSAQQLTVVAGQ